MFELNIKFDFDEDSLREAMYEEIRSGIEATAAGITCPHHGKSATFTWPQGSLPFGDSLRFEAEVCCPKLEALLGEALGGTPDPADGSNDGEPTMGN